MILLTQRDIPYLPLPNRIEITASTLCAPEELTETGFMFGFFEDQRVVMANNRRRGIEVAGGHKEYINGVRETSLEAAIRELPEETGYQVTTAVPVGYLKMISDGQAPADWRYPHPLGYQQFFAGLITGQVDFTANDECLDPIILQPNEVEAHLRPGRLALYKEAFRTIFG
jgi:8-oxo-dGTP pyrophosphatase MutT (NUDIX family)